MLVTQKSNHKLLTVQGHQPPLRQWGPKMQPKTISVTNGSRDLLVNSEHK